MKTQKTAKIRAFKAKNEFFKGWFVVDVVYYGIIRKKFIGISKSNEQNKAIDWAKQQGFTNIKFVA